MSTVAARDGRLEVDVESGKVKEFRFCLGDDSDTFEISS
jgi:hypothetical protein